MFWKTYRAWLLKILKIRLLLCQKGYSPELKTEAEKLKQLIEYHGYKSNQLLAGFLTRKAEVIEQLIPFNTAYEKQKTTLQTAVKEARQYI